MSYQEANQTQLPPSTEWIVAALDRIDRRLTALERARAKPTIWLHPEFWGVPAIMLIGIVAMICITVLR